MTISNEMMTLLGLIATVVVIMGGSLLAIGRYQRQVDQNTTDIDEESKDRKQQDAEIRETQKEDRISSYKRDSDLTKEIRRCEDDCRKEFDRIERRVADMERYNEARTIPLKKKEG